MIKPFINPQAGRNWLVKPQGIVLALAKPLQSLKYRVLEDPEIPSDRNEIRTLVEATSVYR